MMKKLQILVNPVNLDGPQMNQDVKCTIIVDLVGNVYSLVAKSVWVDRIYVRNIHWLQNLFGK